MFKLLKTLFEKLRPGARKASKAEAKEINKRLKQYKKWAKEKE